MCLLLKQLELIMNTCNRGFKHINDFYFQPALIELIDQHLSETHHLNSETFYVLLAEINQQFAPKIRFFARKTAQETASEYDYATWLSSHQRITLEDLTRFCPATLDQHRCPLPLLIIQLTLACLNAQLQQRTLRMTLTMDKEHADFCQHMVEHISKVLYKELQLGQVVNLTPKATLCLRKSA
ncbi:hypothetical protein PTD2_21642 [Pseudoalteromonas tunicata D2]|jgi:paraquat-inducible protein B|uniref:Uncharacterized protein n=2 Tax=Pseudoalteromonas tunicata TaxID=314281 RepID=A4CAQ4_9GAMM|nr:hypothetical protein PTD2_21642 [Pseudoalteromonas tunicata D2]